jgi:hypothetical protein
MIREVQEEGGRLRSLQCTTKAEMAKQVKKSGSRLIKLPGT